jgi:DNA-binding NarL/FixJ family response regulator
LEKQEFETLRDLIILLLVKSGVSYEAIAEVTDSSAKTIQNRFPLAKVVRKRENA